MVKEGDTFLPAGPEGPAPYIAKFNSNAIDSLVRNELRSLQWTAAILGKGEVTEFKLDQVQGEVALIVTRFDRTSKGEKLRLEDFAQILEKPRGADFGGKYESSYEEVASVIRIHSSRAIVDLARYFKRLIVFALVANCDAHLKNFSLLETRQGLRLSPVYDVLNTAIYDGYNRNFGLAFLDDHRHVESLTGILFREFGRKIGLPDAAVQQIFKDLKRQVQKNQIVPPAAEGPDGFVTRFAEIVRNQCLRILEE